MASDVTQEQFLAVFPHAPVERLPAILAAMTQANVTTPLRQAAYLAQCGWESDQFRATEERWGPTDAQLGYEGRLDLGNDRPGDGYLFRGRGDIGITGRKNYVRAGKVLGIDLVNHPELAAVSPGCHLVAAWFWVVHSLNRRADDGDFEGITKIINGGLNGLAGRRKYYDALLQALGAVPACGPAGGG